MVPPAAAGVAGVLVLALEDADADDDELAGAVTVAVAVDADAVGADVDGDEPLPEELLEQAVIASAATTVPRHHTVRDINAPSGGDR
ncbi:hypothetical protein [uncultured Jatrophihabitans sp.]|uniref:hypothetical protein n=1 Tax=uncultured Jatrophihabitans sp. TaxID=1610747 RepID=UPI0035CB2147